VEGQIAEFSGLDTQVLESFGGRVDRLIDEFSLYFVFGHNRPPQRFIEHFGQGFQHPLRYVNVAAVLDDFLVHQVRNLSRGVMGRTIKLESLRRRPFF
jgi:hypothetical protein